MRPFAELEVWRVGHALTLDVYALTKSFPREELYGLTSQLRRAASSIPTNIVEGSVHSDREFARYLGIALRSAAETEYLLLARDLGFLAPDTHQLLTAQVKSVCRMLVSFQRTLHQQPPADERSPSKRRPQTSAGASRDVRCACPSENLSPMADGR